MLRCARAIGRTALLGNAFRGSACGRHFSDGSKEQDASGGSSSSQVEVVRSIIDDVKVEEAEQTVAQESPRPYEPTFGDMFANLGVNDMQLESWFKLQQFPEEEVPVLEELSAREIKRREKAVRRAEEMRKMKVLADSRVRVVDMFGIAHATGKRKESIAIVDLKEGTGNITINHYMTHDEYFKLLDHRVHYLEPFLATNTLGKFDVSAVLRGGGISGQAGALRHGISKALQLFDPELRPPLRKGGFLTRDPRVVERKKPGRAKARKSFQWVKR